jgi:hypothetical protein
MLLNRIRLATFILGATLAVPAFAATPLAPAKVKVNELVQELQQSSSDASSIDLVWWIPAEFWAAALAQDPNTGAATQKEFTELFQKYTVVAAVKGDMGTLGVSNFESEEALRGKLRILDMSGKRVAPLPTEDVDPKLGMLLQVMRPMFKSLLGTLGDNLQFYVFAQSPAGGRIIDPLATGQFTVLLGEERYAYRLPLGSLLVPQQDPATGEVFPGSFSFNPYTGAPLSTANP